MNDESIIKEALTNIKARRNQRRKKDEWEARIEKMTQAVMEQGGNANIQHDEARREVLKIINETESKGPVQPPDIMLWNYERY